MKLLKETVRRYFSLPNERRSANLSGKNPYDFIGRRSDNLIVTIGDSWTWGANLTKQKLNDVRHIEKLPDDSYRLENVYGGVISKTLNTDFLNLGEPGSDNYFIANKLKELHKIIDQLDYDSVTVICVFTEVARGFLGPDDNLFTSPRGRSWLNDNIKIDSDYYKFLKFMNQEVADQIVPLLDKLTVKFATNFVDPIGFEKLESNFLPKTWLQTWCESTNQDYPEPCYLVSGWVFQKLEQVFDLCPTLNKQMFFKWADVEMQKADKRIQLCRQDNVDFGGLMHPLAGAHKVWADYILGEINI